MNEKNKSYRVITNSGTGEIEVKKSRFIGYACKVESQDEAAAIIAEISKKYWDARHNCYAYIIGESGENARFSDNGEPSGTAGKPIMEVISGAGLTNTLIIVTRYFGGTLLGTGGLVRAYTQAAQAALQAADTAVMTYGQKLTFTVGYSMIDSITHAFGLMGIELMNPQYGADVSYDIIVAESEIDTVKDKLTGMTSGQVTITEGPMDYYPIAQE